MNKKAILISGDSLTLAVITFIGFATHGEIAVSFAPRMLTTFIPLVVGWFLIAPWLGLFKPEIYANPRQLWRPMLAMLLAAPMAGILRAAMLHSAAVPLFVLILGSSAALGMLVWRSLWWIIVRKK